MPNEVCELFKYETSPLLENFPYNYLPAQFCEDGEEKHSNAKQPEQLKCLQPSEYKILNYHGIPSSMTLLQVDSAPIEDTRLFKSKRSGIREKTYPTFIDKEEIKD